jgi:hypothetical protein
MIPPYFLDVRPTDSVLDACAAPGSKTTQFLEMAASGSIVANEMDLRRCHDLVHQLQRVGTERCLVTCQMAQYLEIGDERFDRVLCDVPCSGDGTIRKNPEAGANWAVDGGLSLHFVQRSILIRGLEVLRVNGRCVYSTCSMNPIEDEAVVNSVVAQIGGAVEIVDCSGLYPDLKRRPGLASWPVLLADMEPIEDPEGRRNYSWTMFPGDGNDDLRRCMRFYPQDADSGGFFVAVLRKIADFPKISQPSRNPPKEFKEVQYRPLESISPESLSELRGIFGLGSDFPSEQVFVRGTEKVNAVYFFASPIAARLVRELPHGSIRAVSGGVKLFTYKSFQKGQPEIPYPAPEGVHVASKLMTKRKFALTPGEMKRLLDSRTEVLSYGSVRAELAEEMRTGPPTGALLCIEKTDFEVSCVTFRANFALFVKKEIRELERARLALAYPDLSM